MSAPATLSHAAGRAFDSLAEIYDDVFTHSIIGRSQREAVWQTVLDTFKPRDRILEINCGTGEDAIFLARHGMTVLACDASERMIAVAEHRRAIEAPVSSVEFLLLPTEQLGDLNGLRPFDGVFSNFSGLNCVADLESVARTLASLVRPGGSLLLCLSTRCCLWEAFWFIARAEFAKASRRWSGKATAQVDGISVNVCYPTIRALRRIFSPEFRLGSYKGIGITVPPSYLEPWASRHPQVICWMRKLDQAICRCPILRATGDHVLLQFERCQV
jgi:2-polyprenyl-3-methyl-5-hydroxy-6-metoxy-1,4-benzoquinol methylase